MASATTSSSFYPMFSAQNHSTDSDGPKFSHYRKQLLLGDLPEDFLRVKINEPVVIPPDSYPNHPGYAQHIQNPHFLGHLTLTIAEARLVKGSGYLGLVKADPYVSFRIGHVQYETPTATSGGKNPQWKASYRLNLFRGMDRIYFQVFDQRNFTEDTLIGECEVVIPREVMEGETRHSWYPLYNRDSRDTQGDLLIVMSLAGAVRSSAPTGAGATASTAGVNNAQSGASATNPTYDERAEDSANNKNSSASVMPKPQAAVYSQEDVKTIEEMFPKTDRRIIIELLEKNSGNTDLVVNHLLQNAV